VRFVHRLSLIRSISAVGLLLLLRERALAGDVPISIMQGTPRGARSSIAPYASGTDGTLYYGIDAPDAWNVENRFFRYIDDNAFVAQGDFAVGVEYPMLTGHHDGETWGWEFLSPAGRTIVTQTMQYQAVGPFGYTNCYSFLVGDPQMQCNVSVEYAATLLPLQCSQAPGLYTVLLTHDTVLIASFHFRVQPGAEFTSISLTSLTGSPVNFIYPADYDSEPDLPKLPPGYNQARLVLKVFSCGKPVPNLPVSIRDFTITNDGGHRESLHNVGQPGRGQLNPLNGMTDANGQFVATYSADHYGSSQRLRFQIRQDPSDPTNTVLSDYLELPVRGWELASLPLPSLVYAVSRSDTARHPNTAWSLPEVNNLIADLADFYVNDPRNPNHRPLSLNDQSTASEGTTPHVYGGHLDLNGSETKHKLHKIGFDVDINQCCIVLNKKDLLQLARTNDIPVEDCEPAFINGQPNPLIHFRFLRSCKTSPTN